MTTNDKATSTTDDHFGSCPECGQALVYLNIGREHWFYCDEHRVKWCVGENLFSSWRLQGPAQWEENHRKLQGYRELAPASTAAEGTEVEERTGPREAAGPVRGHDDEPLSLDSLAHRTAAASRDGWSSAHNSRGALMNGPDPFSALSEETAPTYSLTKDELRYLAVHWATLQVNNDARCV